MKGEHRAESLITAQAEIERLTRERDEARGNAETFRQSQYALETRVITLTQAATAKARETIIAMISELDVSDDVWTGKPAELVRKVQAERDAAIARAEAAAAEAEKEKERAEKFMWQVRDTCTRAEKAEALRDEWCGAYTEARAERDAAHARGIAKGRALQAEEDARIAEDFDWRGMGALDAYQVPQMIASRIRAEAERQKERGGET